MEAELLPYLTMESITACYEGLAVGFAANEPGLLASLQTRFLPGWQLVNCLPSLVYRIHASPEDASHQTYTLDLDNSQLCQTPSRAQLLDALVTHLDQTVAENASGKLFVHAGAVVWRGGALLIPGPSHTGKSTLVRELVRAGARYYSDEYALFDEDGWVYPYPRPLALRSSNGNKWSIHVKLLSSLEDLCPVPVRSVLVTSYRNGAVWDPKPITPGEAVLAAFSNTVRAQAEPERAMKILCKALCNAKAYRSLRPEAQVTARQMLDVGHW